LLSAGTAEPSRSSRTAERGAGLRYLEYEDACRAIDRARERAAALGDPQLAPQQRLEDCNEHLVKSGLATPAAAYEGETYPEMHVKAAVLTLAFARLQRCPDGNKRVAYILMLAFLAINGYWVEADQEEAADVLLAATLEPADDQARASLAAWIQVKMHLIEMPE